MELIHYEFTKLKFVSLGKTTIDRNKFQTVKNSYLSNKPIGGFRG